jgi:hypothetical protein
MDQLAAAVAKHHGRVKEILHVLGRYGFAEWASRGASIPGVKVVQQLVDPAGTQLVARRAGPTIGGFSVAGLALASGAMVTWRRLASNRPGHQSLVQRARMMVIAAPRRPTEAPTGS